MNINFICRRNSSSPPAKGLHEVAHSRGCRRYSRRQLVDVRMEHQGIETELAGRTRLTWYWHLRSERLMNGLVSMVEEVKGHAGHRAIIKQ